MPALEVKKYVFVEWLLGIGVRRWAGMVKEMGVKHFLGLRAEFAVFYDQGIVADYSP